MEPGCRRLLFAVGCHERGVQQFDPMPHRHYTAALQVRNATDVGRGDGAGLQQLQVAEFAIAQRVRKFGLQYRIGAGGAAA